LPPLSKNLKVPLLLVHGISDTNVHFIHSARMFDALSAANKRFDSLFFPGKDHGLKGPSARVHLFSTVMRFIEDNL
jgi:dipeptidyl-peptidase-4